MTESSHTKQTRSLNDEEKAKRREDILDAAETAFFSSHYDKVSIGHIAKQAGLSRPLIYVYFEDKADLYLAIMARASDALRTRFIDAYKADESGHLQIKALGYAYYGFYRDKPEYFHMFSDARALLNQFPGDPSDKEQQTMRLLVKTAKDCMAIMIKALANGTKDGSLCQVRAGDPVKAAYFLRGMLHGVILGATSDQAFSKNQSELNLKELIDYSIANASYALASHST